MHVYEVRPRRDKRGFDLISDALPFGGLWYLKVPDAIEYAQHYSRAHHAVIRVYDESGIARGDHYWPDHRLSDYLAEVRPFHAIHSETTCGCQHGFQMSVFPRVLKPCLVKI